MYGSPRMSVVMGRRRAIITTSEGSREWVPAVDGKAEERRMAGVVADLIGQFLADKSAELRRVPVNVLLDAIGAAIGFINRGQYANAKAVLWEAERAASSARREAMQEEERG